MSPEAVGKDDSERLRELFGVDLGSAEARCIRPVLDCPDVQQIPTTGEAAARDYGRGCMVFRLENGDTRRDVVVTQHGDGGFFSVEAYGDRRESVPYVCFERAAEIAMNWLGVQRERQGHYSFV